MVWHCAFDLYVQGNIPFAYLFCIGSWHAELAVVCSCKETHNELQLCMAWYQWHTLHNLHAECWHCDLGVLCLILIPPLLLSAHQSSCAGCQAVGEPCSCCVCPASRAKPSHFCPRSSRTDTVHTPDTKLWKMRHSASTSPHPPLMQHTSTS